MAVFVSASDETAGKDQRGFFYRAGFVAPENDWSEYFSPAWQDRVLLGPPEIPYLHMTEIRSRAWREEHGLSRLQAEDRVDGAFAVIDAMGSLFPISTRVDAGFLKDSFSKFKVIMSTGGAKDFNPDYLCFLGYAWIVLDYVEKKHPHAEKVDFVVERNGEITKHIAEFHASLEHSLDMIKRPSLKRLIGELIPGGKDRVPLQAADVLCWHDARHQAGTLDPAGERRFSKIAVKKGKRFEWSNSMISNLVKVFSV